MIAIARPLALAVAIVAVAACDDGPVAPPLSQIAAQARWQRANIDSYQITVQRLCFCGSVDPVRVSVSGGEIVSRVNVVTGQAVAHDREELFPDIPGLFAIVNDARRNADVMSVDYDVTYGFPRAIVIDWRTGFADDEITYYTENFTVGSP